MDVIAELVVQHRLVRHLLTQLVTPEAFEHADNPERAQRADNLETAQRAVFAHLVAVERAMLPIVSSMDTQETIAASQAVAQALTELFVDKDDGMAAEAYAALAVTLEELFAAELVLIREARPALTASDQWLRLAADVRLTFLACLGPHSVQ